MLNIDRLVTPRNRESNISKTRQENRTRRFLRAGLPLLTSEDAREHVVNRHADRIVRLLTGVNSDVSLCEIRSQVMLAVRHILNNKRSLICQAEQNDGKLYLRPEDYLGPLGGKIQTDEPLHPKETEYFGSHIMITKQGEVYDIDIIPKHPDLWLGDGTYKYVRTAIRYRSGPHDFQLVAIFSAGGRNGIQKSAHLEIKREVTLFNEINSESLLGRFQCLFYERVVNGEKVIKAKTIMPLANRGDLYDYLCQGGIQRDLKTLKVTESGELLLSIMMACVTALKQQHNAGIVNGDLKLENVLLHIINLGQKNQKVICLLADLGFAYRLEEALTRQKSGTYMFQGPEMGDQSTNQSSAIVDGQAQDILSLGFIFHKLSTLSVELPRYAAQSYSENKQLYDWFFYATAWSRGKSGDSYQSLVEMMMHPDPSKRPSIHEVEDELLRFYQGETVSRWETELVSEKQRILDAVNTIDLTRRIHERFAYQFEKVPSRDHLCTYTIIDSCADVERKFVFRDDSGKVEHIWFNQIFITDSTSVFKSLELTPDSPDDLYVRYLSDKNTFAFYRINPEGIDEFTLNPCNFQSLYTMSREYQLAFHTYKRSFTSFFDSTTANFLSMRKLARFDLCNLILEEFKRQGIVMLQGAKNYRLNRRDYFKFSAIFQSRIDYFNQCFPDRDIP